MQEREVRTNGKKKLRVSHSSMNILANIRISFQANVTHWKNSTTHCIGPIAMLSHHSLESRPREVFVKMWLLLPKGTFTWPPQSMPFVGQVFLYVDLCFSSMVSVIFLPAKKLRRGQAHGTNYSFFCCTGTLGYPLPSILPVQNSSHLQTSLW